MSGLRLQVLDNALLQQIIDEGFKLLLDPGVRIHNAEALDLLAQAGARVNFDQQTANIPEILVRDALASAQKDFYLYDLIGNPCVHYGGDEVHFTPGSTAVSILDRNTGIHRPATTEDFVQFVKLVESLPQFDSQSTAFIPQDVPAGIGDLYRLYLALNYMQKPIITGAFAKDTWWVMWELLSCVVGGEENLRNKPIAVFDVCPTPPLLWSDFTCQNLIDCAKKGIPAEIVSMPLAGATAPVTLAGAVVQHTAESLSGVTINQLAKRGAPVIWGGAPAAFDMRAGTTPMGDANTWLIDMATIQVGKALGLPTHTYMGSSDAKLLDVQSGIESAGGAILAALSGVNMVAGAGMLDFLRCQSFEKLVIDAEIISIAKRIVSGIEKRNETLALDLMRSQGHHANFLSLPHTHEWFRKELYMPTEIMDRGSLDAWELSGKKSIHERSSDRVDRLIAKYQPATLSQMMRDELRVIASLAASKHGMHELPALPD
jgi:trimethylamine---corrinoid protein Co-methyltransferase